MKNKKLLWLLCFAITFLFIVDIQCDIIKSNTVNKIEDLVKSYPSQDVLIIFDIDDTVLIHDLARTQAFPVEDKVVNLISSLQDRGFQVLVLTARSPDWVDFTKKQFASCRIDFKINNPKNEQVVLSINGASYSDGILFCGSLAMGESAKGLVLNDFLRATDNKCRVIISIDDKYDNLIAEEKIAAQKNIEFKGIHYKGFDKFVQSYSKRVERLFKPKTPTGSLIRHNHSNGAFKGALIEFYKNRACSLIKDPNFNSMMQTIASRENCFCNAAVESLNTHCVFYSSVPPCIAYLYDILFVFYDVFKNKKFYDITPLRISYSDFQKIRNVKELIAYNEEEDKKEMAAKVCKGSWDQRPIMRRTTLCANAALFETVDVCSYSESAIDYFIYPRLDGGALQLCDHELSLKKLLYEVFEFFGIEQYFEPFGMRLINMISPSVGSNPINAFFDINHSSRLFQIFIPREYVDQCVYFCIGGGNAYKTDMSASSTCEILKSGKPFDLTYTPQPGFVPGAPVRQVRVMLQPSLFLNPGNGFKIFKYNKSGKNSVWEPGYFSELYRMAHDIKQYKDGKELTHKIKVEDRLEVLLENFKQYKTRNIQFHSGDLFEHSIWAGNAVKMWAADNNCVWCEGLDENDIRLAYLAAILHDVGKAGDLIFQYFRKSNHPRDGFLYLSGKKNYWIDPEIKFDFAKMFQRLGIDESSQKIIAILVDIHGIFGTDLVRHRAIPENISSYISRISDVCSDIGYDFDRNDKRLLRLAVLLSAADIKGAQFVPDNGHVFFEIRHCSYSPTHHSGANQFELLKFSTKGVQVRKQLLEFFEEQHSPVVDTTSTMTESGI